eukprot:169212-Hanusia_phi.AAC.1
MDSRGAGESSLHFDRTEFETDNLPAATSRSHLKKEEEEIPNMSAADCKKIHRATFNKKSIAASWGSFKLPADALQASDDHPPIFKRRAEFKGEACVGQKLTITAKPLPGVQIKVSLRSLCPLISHKCRKDFTLHFKWYRISPQVRRASSMPGCDSKQGTSSKFLPVEEIQQSHRASYVCTEQDRGCGIMCRFDDSAHVRLSHSRACSCLPQFPDGSMASCTLAVTDTLVEAEEGSVDFPVIV